MRKNKFNAKRVIDRDYGMFDSQMEYARFKELKLLEKAGEITDLERQPEYLIEINGDRICFVVLDFRYKDKIGKTQVEDVKGRDNALSKLKRKLVEAQYDIDVWLTRPRK